MDVAEKRELITRNLAECIDSYGANSMDKILAERPLKVYWGTATTGRPHIAYFVPISKLADFLKAGCEVTVLFADLHAYLDNQKAPWEVLNYRVQYYEYVIKGMLKSIGVSLENLKFVRGTDYQLSKEYTLDVYRISSTSTLRDCKKAGAEVVKQVQSPLLSGLLYPCLQALDEKYLECDAQFGGVDQRKIFVFAAQTMPNLGYKKCIHLMNPMVPGLTGGKMSSSDAKSKIDILDSEKQVAAKIKGAYCAEKEVEGNGVLAFAKQVLFSVRDEVFIPRDEANGGDVTYSSYDALEADFVAGSLHPGDLKSGVTKAINQLLAPIRQDFATNKEMQKVEKLAYPKEGSETRAMDVSRIDLRVGLVKKVCDHPSADSLYVEEIDVGEDTPRTVVSGLKKHISAEEFTNRLVVVVCNLKKSKLRGQESEAMVLCAALDDKVELVSPAEGSKAGDKIFVAKCTGEPDKEINTKKKVNAWTAVLPDLMTDGQCLASYRGVELQTEAGPCTVATLANANLR